MVLKNSEFSLSFFLNRIFIVNNQIWSETSRYHIEKMCPNNIYVRHSLMDPTTLAKDQKMTVISFNKSTNGWFNCNRVISGSTDSETPVTFELLFRDTKKSPKSDWKLNWVEYMYQLFTITHKISKLINLLIK